MLEHRFVSSALHCLTGSSHTAQMYRSPSLNDAVGGVTAISVNVALSFRIGDEPRRFFDVLATCDRCLFAEL